MMMTGRRPSQNGYSKTHPVLLDFNPTLAGVLQQAGYRTAADPGQPERGRAARLRAGVRDATARPGRRRPSTPRWTAPAPSPTDGIAYLRAARPDQPFFLWLHYVNPHAPYTPPRAVRPRVPRRVRTRDPSCPRSPASTAASRRSGRCRARRLGYYVAQYDGEIAAVDDGGRPRARRAGGVTGRRPDGGRAHLRPRREPRRARLLLRSRRGPLRSLPGDPAHRDDPGRAGGTPGAGARPPPSTSSRPSSTPSRCRTRRTSPAPACCPRSPAARHRRGSGSSRRTTATSAPPSTRASSSWPRRSIRARPAWPSTTA